MRKRLLQHEDLHTACQSSLVNKIETEGRKNAKVQTSTDAAETGSPFVIFATFCAEFGSPTKKAAASTAS
jgi:hypothetical protein